MLLTDCDRHPRSSDRRAGEPLPGAGPLHVCGPGRSRSHDRHGLWAGRAEDPGVHPCDQPETRHRGGRGPGEDVDELWIRKTQVQTSEWEQSEKGTFLSSRCFSCNSFWPLCSSSFFLPPSDCHVHSHDASSCGATGQKLLETSRCGLHRFCWQASWESGTEGATHVGGREEVRPCCTTHIHDITAQFGHWCAFELAQMLPDYKRKCKMNVKKN